MKWIASWQGRHTAIKTRSSSVLVFFMDFEDEALDYAIANQRHRRNISDADIMKVLRLVDKRRKPGGDLRASVGKPTKAPSAVETAEKLDIPQNKVNDFRAVEKYVRETGDRQPVEEVEAGKISLNKAAKAVREKKRAAKPPKSEPPVTEP